MKVLDVSVDLWGSLVVQGHIACAGAQWGHFSAGGHSSMSIDARAECIGIRGVKVWKDSVSGFLITEPVAPAIVLPRSLSLIIQDALKAQPDGPLHVALTNVKGENRSQLSQTGGETRILADWTLDISVDGENLNVVIVGSPRGTGTLPSWEARRPNGQAAQSNEQQRVAIKFEVNLATRIAAFGARIHEWPDGADLPKGAFAPMTSIHPRLEDAPIGLWGQMFVRATGDGWIEIVDQGEGLTLIPHRGALMRCASGFIKPSVDPAWPCISAWVSMDRIVTAVLGDGAGESDTIARMSVEWDRGEVFHVERARIQVRLVEGGLEFSYEGPPEVAPEGRQHLLKGRFMIPWEILILRYPRIGRLNPRAKKHLS